MIEAQQSSDVVVQERAMKANSLQVTDVERILSAAIAWVLAPELAVGLLLGLGLFQRCKLSLKRLR